MEPNFHHYINSRTRVYWHIAFWLTFLFYHALIIGSFEDRSFQEELLWEALDLPVKIAATYVLLYILLPRYFIRKKVITFSLLFILLLAFAALLQSLFFHFLVNPLLRPDPSSYTANYLLQPNRILKIVFGIYPVVVLAAFIKMAKNWYQRERESQKLQREKVEAELNFLKAQIHPHFLFNTLNNLYALTLKRSEKASEVVLKLSHLLHHLLYEGNETQIALEKELEIINTYVSLEKIRYGERLEVNLSVQGQSTGKAIPPMLLLPFVENSFKHGASQQLEQVWISMIVTIHEQKLEFQVKNSKLLAANTSLGGAVPQGIGLKNVKRRLALLYGDNYHLSIQDKGTSFQVDMSIPLTSILPQPAIHDETKLLYS